MDNQSNLDTKYHQAINEKETTNLDKKILELFPGEAVNKRLGNSEVLKSRELPSFVADWLIKRYSNGNELDTNALQRFIDTFLPDRNRTELIKHKLIIDREKVKLLANFRVIPDIRTGEERLEVQALDIGGKEGIVDPVILNECPNLLDGGMWGVGELTWHEGDKKNNGKVVLHDFKPFSPYQANLEYYRKARTKFDDTTEWIDFLLRAMGYDPTSFELITQKLWMICRLLPFVEPRVNLIELAPKGTGKSFVFGRLSKYGWLISGGSVSRAQLFFDLNKKRRGMITRTDYIALDEITTIKFQSKEEIIGALKGYLESGTWNVGTQQGTGEAGLVILGNMPLDSMKKPQSSFYMDSLPDFMQESAFIDRFHGFIEGWNLPRVTYGSVTSVEWALNSEFFSEILHSLRNDTIPASIVGKLLSIPHESDKRDVTAITRLTSGLMKLLYPHVRSEKDIPINEFENYCFSQAFEMRKIIRQQLHLLDKEFKEDMPDIKVKESV